MYSDRIITRAIKIMWIAILACCYSSLVAQQDTPTGSNSSSTPSARPETTSEESSASSSQNEADMESNASRLVVSAPDPSISLSVEPLKKLHADVEAAALAGNNAWVLLCSVLVLFMTAPGLAMFYGGLVRKKNVISIIMQCIFLMSLMSIAWALYGYSLCFGGTAPRQVAENYFIGNLDHLFMNNVSRQWNSDTMSPETPMRDTIPRLTHMLFQGMLFIIAPTLICGAFAERMKFNAMALFSLLWGTFVYCPLAHWIWGGGLLSFDIGLLGGALDFAGGTVVHISSGVSALIAAFVLGPRLGFRREPMPPHNLTYTSLGAGMLWVGWLGLNSGSALVSNELTASAFASTHFAAAGGALSWLIVERIYRGKPTVLGASSGLVAGLVCITPAAGHVNPMPALTMGIIAGVACYFACSLLKRLFKYDDALDVFGIHAIGGTLGALLTGIFATRACWDIGSGRPLGLLEGGSVLAGQAVATLVAWIYTALVTWLLLKIVDMLIGLRVPANEERQGLDVTQHGEEGYIFL
ncbi:MAG: Ammonia channel precursor [Planctomycetota bacterium]|jgi:Amt family ammonium transporter